jgi:hypothetical protein
VEHLLDLSQDPEVLDIVQNNKNHKDHEKDKTGLGEAFLEFLTDRFAPDSLDQNKKEVPAIKGWNGKQIDHSKVHAEKCR